VPASAADRFKTLALDVKSAFSRFTDANVFNRVSAPLSEGARAQ
jgi:hypothetical protein